MYRYVQYMFWEIPALLALNYLQSTQPEAFAQPSFCDAFS